MAKCKLTKDELLNALRQISDKLGTAIPDDCEQEMRFAFNVAVDALYRATGETPNKYPSHKCADCDALETIDQTAWQKFERT